MGLKGIKENDGKYQTNGNTNLYWRIIQFYGVNLVNKTVSVEIELYPNKEYRDAHPGDVLERRNEILSFGDVEREQFSALAYETLKAMSETVSIVDADGNTIETMIFPYSNLIDVIE